ncbi:uncharacterized protein [Physcomitrium patens]|uniref:DUF1279 domain-containing protein n=1 Tax=Physcomitrium patens TaxID=3218 RepID=A0A2K1JIB9_PHYPA|nr:uncharacterized protein LOC112291567 [Physcomitrium patens]PNR41301.1 hypothetical protein PHYPA_018704 [Physcomitrium patens]|eukprot:XP_024394924.1 uncharacterized protein LOC112291567 [Physcomitrella patens]
MSLLSTDLVHEWRTSLPVHASPVVSSNVRPSSCGFRSKLKGGKVGPLSTMPVLGLVGSKRSGVLCAATKEGKEKEQDTKDIDAETVTKKYGLEAGLWKIFSSKDKENSPEQGTKTNQAKELLKRYGGAYLVTSISLSIVSFSLCYVLVQAGVDVTSLLDKVGIHANDTGEKVGTFALAYAAHKALSPVRFPPTVALTPIVAGWFGKKPEDDNDKTCS